MTPEELKRRGWEYDEHGWWTDGSVIPQFTSTQAGGIEQVIDARLREFWVWMHSVEPQGDIGVVMNDTIRDFYASREKKNDA
jgi:hypothetical protein